MSYCANRDNNSDVNNTVRRYSADSKKISPSPYFFARLQPEAQAVADSHAEAESVVVEQIIEFSQLNARLNRHRPLLMIYLTTTTTNDSLSFAILNRQHIF